jgi:hypothetical protein
MYGDDTAGNSFGSLYLSLPTMMAQVIRAILLMSATAATFICRRSVIRASQPPRVVLTRSECPPWPLRRAAIARSDCPAWWMIDRSNLCHDGFIVANKNIETK